MGQHAIQYWNEIDGWHTLRSPVRNPEQAKELLPSLSLWRNGACYRLMKDGTEVARAEGGKAVEVNNG